MKRDIFAESKKLSNIVSEIRKTLIQKNFYELFPPAIVNYNEKMKKGFKFADGKNFYLLKPDVTSWLIEMDKVKDEERIFYVSEVLTDNLSSSWQLGFEILNGEQIKIEEEIINLTIDILSKLGIKNFFIDVSSIKCWEDILESVPDFKEKILRAIELRNFEIIENLPLDQKIKNKVGDLFNYRGKETNLPKLNKIIKEINDSRIFVDLGTIKYMDYYEDIVFEIYSPDNGYLLGNGGQYQVNGKYSCGMALNLDVIREMKR